MGGQELFTVDAGETFLGLNILEIRFHRLSVHSSHSPELGFSLPLGCCKSKFSSN